MEKKRESQKMAAFNLGVAEAVHTKKHARDPFHVSPIPPDTLFCNASRAVAVHVLGQSCFYAHKK